METHVLSKLIRKSAPLVAVALQLSLTTAAWSQLPHNRGTLYPDGCYYILKANLVIPAGQPGYVVLERQGCRVLGGDGRIYYYDYRTKISQDELTGTEYVLTNRGWMVLTEYQAQQQQTEPGNSDGLNNPATLKVYKQALDTVNKGTNAGMGLCGGNRSDFDKCLEREAQARRQGNTDADHAYRQKQDVDKAIEKTAEKKREWSKRR
jgi:hypothetical protein